MLWHFGSNFAESLPYVLNQVIFVLDSYGQSNKFNALRANLLIEHHSFVFDERFDITETRCETKNLERLQELFDY